MPNKTSSKDKAEQYRNERKERIAKAAKKRKKNLDKRLKLQKLIGKVIAITLGAAAVLGIAFYILWFTGIFETSPTALTLGEQKVSVRDYTYYYSLMYNYTVNQAKQYQQQYGQDMIGLDLTKSPEDQECPYKNDKDETIRVNFLELSVSGGIVTAPVSLPALVVSVAGYLAVAGGIASAVSQAAVYRDD